MKPVANCDGMLGRAEALDPTYILAIAPLEATRWSDIRRRGASIAYRRGCGWRPGADRSGMGRFSQMGQDRPILPRQREACGSSGLW
jgi:hypothetical protein